MRPNAALGIILVFVLTGFSQSLCAAEPVPKVGEGWTIELIAKAPEVLFPTAIVVAPDGTIFVGQDPMDMPGPPTEPIDSIVALHPDGRRTLFADKLWSVMGLEWIDGALYVVHAPFLSVFRDTDGDGRADAREDLMTGLGPKQPGFNGLNDHIASGCRLGMDGFLYIAVGDKGIPRGVGKDGTTIQLHGGGVIRIRPDGTGLEVVSTGERNPLSVALSVADDIFTYGNDDDSKRWPNSLTHHIVGGHYGYPYQFLNAPARCLPILAGQMGGSGAQGICYNEAGLPAQYRGDLFFCDWGLQTVFRFRLEKAGGTFRLKARENFVEKGDLPDFRPFSMAVSPDGTALYLVDWAFNGWLAKGPQTGRIYRLRYEGPDRVAPASRPRPAANGRLDPIQARAQLDDPALSVRLAAQRELARGGAGQARLLIERLRQGEPRTGRLHALWALDAINTPEARQAIRAALHDNEAALRLQAARSAGIRRDREALASLGALLKDADAAIRREAAIALGKMGDPEAGPWLYEALGDPDPFAAWSIRSAIRALKAWDAARLEAALRDPRRRDDALKLADEAWAVPVVDALIAAFSQTGEAAMRERLLTVLAGLYRRYPEWSGHWFGTNPLAGSMPQKTRAWSPEGMSRVLIGLARGLNDPETSVRRRAIAGLRAVGPPAAPHLRERIAREPDPDNLKALAEALGALSDTGSVPALASLVQAPGHPIEVRAAALDALGLIPGPAALRARLALVYEAKAPTELVARALPSLGRTGTLPPNDLLGFLEKPEAAVRSAALLALAMKPPAPARPRGRPPFVRASAASSVPPEVRQAIIARLGDPDLGVRKAALAATAQLRLREAIPQLLSLARDEATRTEATIALAALPDPRALPILLAALGDRDPQIRRLGERALREIRDLVAGDLEAKARAGALPGPAAEAVERILTRFRPLTDWRVIGPFPRTTAPIFLGETAIDFEQPQIGAEGRTISWQRRAGEPKTGRLVLDDLKGGAGDRGGFGYDTNGSPDLSAFGYAEVVSDRERPAMLLIGSSGSLIVTLNEKIVFHYNNFAGRPYAPDSDLVRVALRRGTNRILVQSRQGIGTWAFSVQVSDPSTSLFATRPGPTDLEALRAFALEHDGDPMRGRALFFDPKGIGCAQCHSAEGQGSASIGPDLTGLALKYDKAEIIRSVLEPSNRIATGYQPVLIARTDGTVQTGLVRNETETAIDLIDTEAQITRIPKAEIVERRVGDVSLMPTGLVDTLKPEEFADLIAFLQSLRSTPATTPSRSVR